MYAHHQHRRSIENCGNFGDCMKGRIRFMTAITSTSAHAYQTTWPHKTHVCGPTPKARYPHLPNDRTTTRQKGYDFQGWAIYTDGGTCAVDGETQAGRGAIARSPLSPPRAHLAFSGTRTYSNNTAEMIAMVEALYFLGPPWPGCP